MPIIRFEVSIEVDTLEGKHPKEKVVEYIRVGVQKSLERESQCIGLLPPDILSRKEKIQTILLDVL